MFESTIDSASLSLSLSYSEHPIPYPMESFLSEQYLFLGAIVQPEITPPVVLDCCERSFFLRSYINRLRSPAKRDPTSSLGSAKAVSAEVPPLLVVHPRSSCSSIATGRVVKFGDYLAGNLHRDSDHLNPFPNGCIFPPGWSFVSASIPDNGGYGARKRKRLR